MGFIRRDFVDGLIRRILLWYRKRLGDRMGSEFDPELSRKLDALAQLLDE